MARLTILQLRKLFALLKESKKGKMRSLKRGLKIFKTGRKFGKLEGKLYKPIKTHRTELLLSGLLGYSAGRIRKEKKK